MEVTDDLVRQVASLSRLAISPAEASGLKKHFEKILAYIAEFQALDTKDVDPSMFSVESSNVYREDEVKPSLPREEALRNAPRVSGPFFLLPRIVGGGPAAEDLEEGSGA